MNSDTFIILAVTFFVVNNIEKAKNKHSFFNNFADFFAVTIRDAIYLILVFVLNDDNEISSAFEIGTEKSAKMLKNCAYFLLFQCCSRQKSDCQYNKGI